MCDWEGCTQGCTPGTIGLPNPNQRSVAKIHRYTARAVVRERILALGGVREDLDGTVVATGNRTIFGAHRILAKHRATAGPMPIKSRYRTNGFHLLRQLLARMRAITEELKRISRTKRKCGDGEELPGS